MTETIHELVRQRYADAALQVLDSPAPRTTDAGCGCGDGGCGGTIGTDGSAEISPWGAGRYEGSELAGLPDAAVLASLGCGNPIAVAELREGETVLDLGSGGGIDVLLSARRVGATGRAIGIDMTDEMLELARRNALEAGVENVEFRKGTIESLPVDDATVDVVISNCVINLAADKAAVFREVARVLRPNGRVGVSDVVADDALSPEDRAARGSYAGCIAGALSFTEYAEGLAAAGLGEIAIEPTHAVADGLYGAIIRARKPAEAGVAVGTDAPAAGAAAAAAASRLARTLPVVAAPETSSGSCCG
jgi:arsenite methyltransferase